MPPVLDPRVEWYLYALMKHTGASSITEMLSQHVVPESPDANLNVLLQSYLIKFIEYLQLDEEKNQVQLVYDRLFEHLTKFNTDGEDVFWGFSRDSHE